MSLKKVKIKNIIIFGLVFLFGYCVKYIHTQKGNPITKKNKVWSIGILSGPTPYSFNTNPNEINPVITASDVTDIEASFVADPFMIMVDSLWYMFFEVGNKRNNQQGDIGLATSKNGIDWNYESIVLDENFHLSYPFVFKWKDDIYMIPESSESYSVRLYKAEMFPYSWSFQRTLLVGNYLDPTLIQHDDKFWLFVGAYSMHKQNVMEIFYSDSLFGTFKSHNKNPIILNSLTSSRPAGRIIKFEDQIIRYAQITEPFYGTGVNAFNIVELNIHNYEEFGADNNPILYTTKSGWNSIGMHQIDPHQMLDGSWIACVDGLAEYRTWGYYW